MNRLPAVILATALSAAPIGAAEPPPAAPPAGAFEGPDAVQDLIFLGENRPIFLRLRLSLGPQPFRLAWLDSVSALYRFLDRDGDGVLSKAEADREALATLVRVVNGGATALPRGDLDVAPRDGVVSVAELTAALRTALGPFRVQVGRLATGRPDALFERLDRDGDASLSRDELTDAAATLSRLDLDEDELIASSELEPFTDPTAILAEAQPGRRARAVEVPPVVELEPDEVSLRPVRQLLKKYDKGSARAASGGDNKLTLGEFAIEPAPFARADTDADGALDAEELRRWLSRPTPDIELTVQLSADASGGATVVVAGGAGSRPLPVWARSQSLGPADVEVAADEVRLEIHADDGAAALADTRRTSLARFEAADTDNNGYVDQAELTRDKNRPSPLNDLLLILDRDGNGQLDSHEMTKFVDHQAEAARTRIVMTVADEGRSIFAILDLNRDRKLGRRELGGTTARMATWDHNDDGRVTAEEIPHHFLLTIGRGQPAGVGKFALGVNPTPPRDAAGPVASGPTWFRRMDQNHDGDVSRREFRGSKAQFDRLDRDKDGLLDPNEAASATAAAAPAADR